MKRAIAALTTASICLLVQNVWAAGDQGAQLKDKKDKISYSIGVDVGKSILKQKIDINPEPFLLGFKDGQADKSTLMTEDEIRQTLMALQTEMLEKQKAEMKDAAAKNLAAGQKFLEDNKKKKDIVTLPSGLEYRIIKDGKGESPKATDVVTTHYRGKLIDGTEFDSSYNRGEPVKFAVNGVIPGWTEALQLMKPGAKWELFIPSKLAYGEHGVGQIIGPNSALIFEVELLSVEKPENKDKSAEKQGKVESKNKKG
ncbi:MAG: FKBP-type peptidyl-prolyl cis-trans isomerase [Gammaproteobacteria bacterium]|jgi:FKBP-type peptidyl-prolyl cis-trans isomerase FklB|nr:FKBP-type peptidyl-prolyl cis-trans isomerase [Gammaproteobacteria bacterium]